ncbi:MAG TPA: hypothetical protein DCG53_01640 [Syntrophus sp. (in: bacteria)]|nr:hypothetical protein [Syntrophus sp. (in: bacteria)]
METTGNERIEFNPQRDIFGKTMGAWCLCPAWMGWMPWLVDGVEVLRVQGKTIKRNMTSHGQRAGLEGI